MGNFFANTAQWLQLLSVGWLVRDLTDSFASSGLLVVTVGGLTTFPTLIMGPLAGVLGDRVDRRKLVMAIQGFMAAAAMVDTTMDKIPLSVLGRLRKDVKEGAKIAFSSPIAAESDCRTDRLS